MGDYDHLLSAWKDKRTGLCHLSFKGTVYPTGYEQISVEAYREWQKTETVSCGGVLPEPIKVDKNNER